MSRILITGVRAPVALDLAGALATAGHEVHGADVFANAMMRGRLAGFHTYAAPRFDPQSFRRDAEAILARLKPDLVVPLCEEVFYWAQLDAPLFAPPLETLMRLHSKYEFARLAAELGLDVPQTERTTRWAPESVYKPEFSRFGTRIHIRPTHDPKLENDPQNPWLRQDYIDGEDLSFYAIAHGGQLRAVAAWRSAWRTHGGASYYFDPVDDPQLWNIARTLVQALDLTGQISCDLRRDMNGKLWLLECNPRATSGLHLLAPEALAEAFLSDGPPLAAGAQPACLGLAMTLYGVPEAVVTGRLAQWQADRKRARDVLQGVTAAALADSLGYSLKAAAKGQGLAAFLTADIECNRLLS